MTITISAGVTSSGLTISSGDPLVVLGGGTVEFGAILSGASATLSTGATAGFLTVSAGGELLGGQLTDVNFDAGFVSGASVGALGFLELLSGGTAANIEVGSAATMLVDSGASASGIRIDRGALVDVLGAVAGAVIDGEEVVYSKGSASGDSVESGAQLVLAGGAASDETVAFGGAFDFEGDLKSDFTLGASQVVAAAVLSGVTVSSGGFLNLISATVLSGATLSLAAAAAADSLVVSKGGVLSGPGDLTGQNDDFGSVDGVTVSGFLEIDAGGTASGVTTAGGLLVEAGGSATGTVLESDETVSSGGVISGGTVQSGKQLTLLGSASGVTVQSGGFFVFGGDLTADFTQTDNQVTATTVLSGVTVSSGGNLLLLGATVLQGVTLILGNGVVAQGVTVSKGGELLGPGTVEGHTVVAGSVGGVTDAFGGLLEIVSGGSAKTVGDQGLLQIDKGGSASGTVVSNFGAESIDSGGVGSGDVVLSGGALALLGGTATDETVRSGGTFEFSEGLKTDFTVTSGPVTSTTVLSGVTVSSGGDLDFFNAKVLNGAILTLAAGAIVDTLTVSTGGVLLGPGGISGQNTVAGSIVGASLESTSELTLLSGASADGVTASQSRSTVQVDLGASATGTVVAGGGELFDFGSTTSTRVISGGFADIFSGGVAFGDIIRSEETISAGGSSVEATVSSGAALFVQALGTTTGTVLSRGGQELVLAGGVASATTVRSGGGVVVSSGGAAIGTIVDAGGSATVLSGGTLSGLALAATGVVIDGGELLISGTHVLGGELAGAGVIAQTAPGNLVLSGNGADFSGEAVISAGRIQLAGAEAIGTASVVFLTGAGLETLQIDASDTPAAGGTLANVISGFDAANDVIDLRNLAFVTGATAKVDGSTLTLTDGGGSYNFNLAGGAASSFTVASDGHGGTQIDPHVAGFAQAAAGFAAAGAAKTAVASASSPTSHMLFLHATASAAAGHP